MSAWEICQKNSARSSCPRSPGCVPIPPQRPGAIKSRSCTRMVDKSPSPLKAFFWRFVASLQRGPLLSTRLERPWEPDPRLGNLITPGLAMPVQGGVNGVRLRSLSLQSTMPLLVAGVDLHHRLAVNQGQTRLSFLQREVLAAVLDKHTLALPVLPPPVFTLPGLPIRALYPTFGHGAEPRRMLLPPGEWLRASNQILELLADSPMTRARIARLTEKNVRTIDSQLRGLRARARS